MHFVSLTSTLVGFLKAQAWGHTEENDMTEPVSMRTAKDTGYF